MSTGRLQYHFEDNKEMKTTAEKLPDGLSNSLIDCSTNVDYTFLRISLRSVAALV
jgi:hypothetical protein